MKKSTSLRDDLKKANRKFKKAIYTRKKELYFQNNRPRLIFITIFTILYLIVELAFQARLLDVVGTLVSVEEVEALEKYGRMISGTAVFLMFFGLFILPKIGRWTSFTPTAWAAFITMAAITIITIVFIGEKALIDHIVDNSTGKQRKVAAHALIIQNALLNDDISIQGIELPPSILQSPEGKSFVALLPFFGSSLMSEGASKESIVKKIVTHSIKKKIGSEKEFLEKHVYPHLKQIKDVYNKHYVPASNTYLQMRRSVARHKAANDVWTEYKKMIAQKGTTLDRIPERYWPTIRKKMHDKGINLPVNWKPSDKISFFRAFKTSYYEKIDRQFKTGARKALGFSPATLKPGLSYDQFVSNQDVRKYLAAKSPHFKKIDFSKKITNRALLKALYYPLVANTISEKIQKLSGSTKDYDNGGKYETIGKAAMRAVVVPPIALFFSMVGGLAHLLKVINYLLSFKIMPRFRLPLLATVMALLIFFMANMDLSNSITRSSLFASMEKSVVKSQGLIVNQCIKKLIETAPITYPLNNMIRTNFLLGYEFKPISRVGKTL